MSESVRLHGMAYGGSAVGRLADGAAIFVAGGLPGETVELDVSERRKNFARGRLIRVTEAVPERVDPPCPYFRAGCGGCQWQHAGYEAQVRYKQDVLTDQLRRIGGIADPPVLDPIPAPNPWSYRNVAEFHVAGGRIGFNREGSHDVVDVESCPIVEEPINRALAAVRTAQKRLAGTAAFQVRQGVDALHVTLITDDDPRGYKLLAGELADRIGGECRVTAVGNATNKMRGLQGDPWVWMELAGQRFRASALSFFQVNTGVANQLLDAVIREVAGGSRVLDLYSGVGTFAILAAERAREVVGVEESPSALADAAANLAESAADNVRFARSDVGAAQAIAEEAWDLAILDPPRAGAPRSILQALNTQRIAYVSCDPSTLARDLQILTARGFHLDSVRLFDMFPQTYHIEALALLGR